ncbi:MAG: M15 family metallopeptidase [Propionicimonas sp.]|nr:M15 family metallopeptidase [Propionicimonas sp.]
MSEPTVGGRQQQPTGPTVGEQAAAIGVQKITTVAVSSIATPAVGKVAGVAAGKLARSRRVRRIIAVVAVVAVVVACIPVFLAASTVVVAAGAISNFMTSSAVAVAQQNACYGTGIDVVGSPEDLTEEQAANLTAILGVVAQRGLGAGDAVITVMTALTESTLVNVGHGDTAGPDSRGLFQQRDTWGPLEVRMDPAGASGLFLDRLVAPELPLYRGNGVLINAAGDTRARTLPWMVAQSVQISAFANGSNYRKNYEQAVALVQASIDPTQMASANAAYWSARDVDGKDIGEAIFNKPVLDTEQIAYCSGTGGTGGGTGAAGPWGGWSNGEIPDEALSPLTWSLAHKLRPDAAAALTALNVQFNAVFGKNIAITDSYRSLAGQVAAKASWCARGACHMAAKPGTSNHGWALAVDLSSGINNWGTAERNWFVANAPALGWISPDWAQPGKGKEEPWHWEYVGTRTSTGDPSVLNPLVRL